MPASRRRFREARSALSLLVTALVGLTVLTVGSAAAAGDVVVQAEAWTTQSGALDEVTADTGGGRDVGWLAGGDWMSYANVDLGGPGPLTVSLRLASVAPAGGRVELRADSRTGALLAGFPVQSTGGWQNWVTRSVVTSSTLTGSHTVFATMVNPQSGDFVNINWFSFAGVGAGPTTPATPTPTPTSPPTTATPIAAVSVVNDVSHKPVLGLSPLVDGSVVDLTALANRNLSLQATLAKGVTAGSVGFSLTGAKGSTYTRTETTAPYFLCNDYIDCPLLVTPDTYTLTVQAYQGANGSGGALGAPRTVRFSVSATAVPVPALNVLFVGNSLLGTATAATGEDTPAVTAHLAAAAGRTLNVTEVIHFGNSLQQTWDGGEVATALNGSTRYDYIVLQEYSTLVPTNLAQATSTLMTTYAPTFTRALKPGGKVVLFKNWALVDPAPFATRAAEVAAINTNYAALSAGLPTPNLVAPISDEFETIIATKGTSSLIVADGKHPNDTAIYLDAVTLYGILFRQSPHDLADLHLGPATATSMRDVAATAIGY